MGLAEFPSELIVDIFSHLDIYGDVRRLCLVCRRFRDIGMPMLYRTVILRGHYQNGLHWPFQIDNPWLRYIQYFGVEHDINGPPSLQDHQEGFSHLRAPPCDPEMIDRDALRFLRLLQKDQLRGMIVCDGLLGDEEIIQYLNVHQRRIRSVYHGQHAHGVRRTISPRITKWMSLGDSFPIGHFLRIRKWVAGGSFPAEWR
ncbi:hypothetical protein Dda_5319 [Drechslerella dactyloides]|uniref:F-box domain-containing protein n=1 Tax=Drechslerella dactyloides TaxID=74499 RepID=A0AAD6J037_DREDA|nr:hypothetical protein Dda_5319 [Drechslerella dactyloides]